MADKLNGLLEREFSFVQELVWLPPRRNPFPRCSDKIISDLRRLGVLYRRYGTVSLNHVDSGGRTSLSSAMIISSIGTRRITDNAAAVMDSDSEQLIRIRRSLCKQLPSFDSHDFEQGLDVLLTTHLEKRWGSCKEGTSIETWASRIRAIDLNALDMRIHHCLNSFLKVQALLVAQRGSLDGKLASIPLSGADQMPLGLPFVTGGCVRVGELQAASSQSNSSQMNNLSDMRNLTEEDNIDDSSEIGSNSEARHIMFQGGLVCNAKKGRNTLNQEVQESDRVLISSDDGTKSGVSNGSIVLKSTPLSNQSTDVIQPSYKTNLEHARMFLCCSTGEQTGVSPITIEMTMKAIHCNKYPAEPEVNCWHIIFGLVSREHCRVVVQSLSYWCLDKESEVTTIKWPRGGIVLKEAPSFVCYSCQIYCKGFHDSPRVAFSWQYRPLQSNSGGTGGRGDCNEGPEVKAFSASKGDVSAVNFKRQENQWKGASICKRLASVWPWGRSHKKLKGL